jgi:hypothetical protein
MESFMDAPVGILREEAGDAALLCAPHHVESIPASETASNRTAKKLSKQFRNVPFLTPLEMSPFGVCALFLSVLPIFLQEFRVGFRSIYSIPVYVVWLGPQRNPA